MIGVMVVGFITSLIVVVVAVPLSTGTGRIPMAGELVTDRRAATRHGRSRGRRRERMLDDAYPDALDLFVVWVQAGHLPLDALLRIRPHVHPAIAASIDEVAGRVRLGQRLVESLDALVEHLGTRALAFVATVSLAERTGLAIAPMIDRIGEDARHHRRRRAEISARELPIRLAVPLVVCTLPSFVLVAIAPLLIGALSSLRGA